MGVVIEESGMRFGDYPEDSVFYIEKSAQYTKTMRQNGIKCCEFLLKKDYHGRSAILFVEAKSSCPNAIEASTAEEKLLKYHEYIDEIAEKMRHSLAQYMGILTKRLPQDSIPAGMLQEDLSEVDLKFVLVIKGAKKEWLIPIRDAINNKLRTEKQIWKTCDMIVINDHIAGERQLILT